MRAPFDDVSLSSERVRREPLVIALPADHPLAAHARIPLKLLAREPFVFFPRQRGPAYFDQVMALCHAAGFSPRIVQEAQHLDMLSLVAAGFGVSILPESIRTAARKGLAIRPIVGSPSTDLLVVWRTDDASPALREFLAFVRRVGVRKARRARRVAST